MPAACAFSSAAMVGGCYCANNANSQAAGAIAEDAAERTMNPFSRADLMSKEEPNSSSDDESQEEAHAQLDEASTDKENGSRQNSARSGDDTAAKNPLLERRIGQSPPRSHKKEKHESRHSSLCGF